MTTLASCVRVGPAEHAQVRLGHERAGHHDVRCANCTVAVLCSTSKSTISAALYNKIDKDNVTNTHTSKDSSGEGELWTVNILVMLIATFLQVLIFLCILDSVLVPLHDIPVDFQPTEIVTWVHLQIFLFTSYVNAAKSSCMLWIINTADAIALVSAHHRAHLCIAQGNSAYHAPV
jgi:hypothetical protein